MRCLSVVALALTVALGGSVSMTALDLLSSPAAAAGGKAAKGAKAAKAKVAKGTKVAKKTKATGSCGTYMYRKGGVCVDARVTPVKK